MTRYFKFRRVFKLLPYIFKNRYLCKVSQLNDLKYLPYLRLYDKISLGKVILFQKVHVMMERIFF